MPCASPDSAHTDAQARSLHAGRARRGSVAFELCVAEPGEGGMGYHDVNPTLAGDLELDPLKPEILLYARECKAMRLVAVEWFVADGGQQRPQLLGQPFDGPMAGHEPGMPTHDDLHAWIWQPNAESRFVGLNPASSCPGAAQQERYTTGTGSLSASPALSFGDRAGLASWKQHSFAWEA